ncbi:MAG: S-layer y domain [Chthonomonadales bacterium]|nr:S-layer y domain [Chthonomonadales bacterium]
MNTPWKVTCVGLSLLSLPAMVQAQDVGRDVPPTHWAYAAVQDLAKKGLIKGYPPDNNFLGNRTLSRYEMATIIERIIGRMDDLLAQQKPATPPAGVSQADFDALKASVGEIRSLVEDFKKELLVIGTDLSKAKEDIESLKQQVGALTEKVNGFDQRLTTTESGLKDAQTAIDQALENIKEVSTNLNAQIAKKVGKNDTTEKLTVTGLLQVWYGEPFGGSLGGNPAGNLSGTPPFRNFGGGVGDTFRLRRGEINFEGNITRAADFKVMLDTAKTGTGGASLLQDLRLGYNIAPRFRAEIGQQKTGLSEEGTRSSAQLLTVERSIMNGLPTTAGRIGDIRDTGAVLRYNGAMANAMIGIWDDNGLTQDIVDTDRTKFATGNLYFTGIRHLTLGIWGGTTIDDARPRPKRDRAGATIKWESGPNLIEIEGAYTRDGAAGSTARTIGLGGYALVAHSLNKRFQLVARYDEWDPAVHGGTTSGLATNLTIPLTHHNLREYTFGVNYFLRGHNSKIQLNFIDVDTQGNGYAFFGTRRQILLSNFQTAF